MRPPHIEGCSGFGGKTCDQCKGTGEVTFGALRVRLTCRPCFGTGTLTCWRCELDVEAPQ